MGCAEAPGCHPMNAVVIYTTRWCPFCVRAKALLDQKGVSYQEIPVDGEPVARQQMAERAAKELRDGLSSGETGLECLDICHLDIVCPYSPYCFDDFCAPLHGLATLSRVAFNVLL